MNTATTKTRTWIKYGPSVAIALGFTGGVVLLLLWLAGTFAPKVSSKSSTLAHGTGEIGGSVVPARLLRIPREESAVGSIRAVHETTVGSKLLARVVEIELKAGQQVQKGDVLVRLDDTDLRARLQQAEAAVMAAEANLQQAERDDQRYAKLLESKTVSRQEREKAATLLKSVQAELRRAKEMVNESTVTLDWATVRAPMDGKVIDKKVNTGDLVSPGQGLVTLFDPKKMQLVASVRESLTRRLEVGQLVKVNIQELNMTCHGTISEIVPEAQAASRSFQIKVTGPCPPGVYSGMFGRVFIPLDDEDVLVIPSRAVKTVGQLDLVEVFEDGHARRRAIRVGRTIDDDLEVLSGLKEGEKVVVPTENGATRHSSEGNHE